MQSYQIKEQKQFMAKLLTGETFDRFLLVEAFIRTFQDFSIDGRLHREFYNAEELEEMPLDPFGAWKENRPVCFSLIKGRHTPLAFQFVLQMNNSHKEQMIKNWDISISPEQIAGFLVTIRFADGRITCTTGTSLTTFLMDKSAERYWDQAFGRFLTRQGIEYDLP